MLRTAARDAAKRPIPTDSASAGSPEGGAATGGQSPSASQAQPVELTLNPSEVLQELRGFRLKRNPAQRLSATPHAFSTKRIVELVRYARSAFRDDRHFQRQLDQETTALKRLDPQLKDLLPDSHR
ncbi:MAG TPA: hypothetical protein VL475_09300 [Planctomycetaceae bacterium]|nr:hypothetical protein [Planctomycetaceae bacterium]